MPERDFSLPPGVEVPELAEALEDAYEIAPLHDKAIADLCRVVREQCEELDAAVERAQELTSLVDEQDRMLTDACAILAADDEERVTKVMHDLGFIEENRWGPMYDAGAFNAMLRSRVREEGEHE